MIIELRLPSQRECILVNTVCKIHFIPAGSCADFYLGCSAPSQAICVQISNCLQTHVWELVLNSVFGQSIGSIGRAEKKQLIKSPDTEAFT